MKYELIMENWRQFTTETNATPDDMLKVLFSAELNSLFKEELNEVESPKTKIKRYAKRFGIPIALAASILAAPRSPSHAGEVATPAAPHIVHAMPPEYQNLSSDEATDKAWKAFEGAKWSLAPRSIGGVPSSYW